jgi:homoserine acetyltransferase
MPWRRSEVPEMTISHVPTHTLPAEGEVGVVHIGSLTLESGVVMDDVDIAVQRWGELSPTRDNVVVVLHALTGDSHITGPAGMVGRHRGSGRADRHRPLVRGGHQRAGRLPRIDRAEFTRP